MQQDEDMLLQSIYEEYQGTLRRIARALNVPNMELEDVVQEVFLNMVANTQESDAGENPERKSD